MKSLCITGFNQAFLEECAQYMEQSGVTPARPAVRGEEISMHIWHDKVCNNHENLKNNGDDNITVGRVWDQIAGDIFFANHAENLWYWSDARSLSLLDYWRSFDPHTYFIIIHVALRDLIAEEINKGQIAKKYLEQVISDWTSKAVGLLKFNADNKERCVIIDHSLFEAKKHDYVKDISSRWNLKLNTPLKHAAKTPVKTEISSLTLYLAEEFIKLFPEALALEKEIQGSLIEVDKNKTRRTAKTSIVESMISEYAELLASMRKNQALMEQETQEKEALKKEFGIQFSEYEKYKAAYAKADEQYKILQEQYSNLKISSERNAEHDYSEKNLIIEALHKSQETLELTLAHKNTISEELNSAAYRISKLLELNPNYWDYETLKISELPGKGAEKTLLWEFTELFLNGRLIKNISFKLITKSNYAGIVFLRGEKADVAPLIRWPADKNYSDELPCTPTKGALTLEQNKIISSLGTSDWAMLKLLVNLIIDLLDNPETLNNQEKIDAGTFKKGLISLKTSLEKWPTVLRFDAVKKGKVFHGESYHSFELLLDNLSYGKKQHRRFSYKIATVDEPDATFGQNPRLEFDQNTSDLFDGWYAESTDHRGPRLELRFARPNAMDTNVWNKISDNDKVLIAGLVGMTPSRIKELSESIPSQSSRWKDWLSLADDIKSTLISNVSPSAKKSNKQI